MMIRGYFPIIKNYNIILVILKYVIRLIPILNYYLFLCFISISIDCYYNVANSYCKSIGNNLFFLFH